MEGYRYLLPWITSLNGSVASGNEGLCLFLLGLFSSLLCFFSIKTIYSFFTGAGRDFSARARLGMAAAVLVLIAGLVLNILPTGDTGFISVNLIQSFGLCGFIVCRFFCIEPAGDNKNGRRLFCVAFGIAGLAAASASVFFEMPSAWFIAALSLPVILALAVIALKRKMKKEPAVSFAPACAEIALIACSGFIPAEELQISLFALPMLLALGRGGIRRAAAAAQTVTTDTAEVEEAAASDPPPETVGELEALEDEFPVYMETPETVGELEVLEDEFPVYTEKPETSENPEKPAAAHKLNPFIPSEFLRLLNKKTVMDLKLGDHHEQEMTIFFSDIRQFTDFFESLSPEEGFKFINSYLTRIVPVIEKYGGFVDKYIGDAVMALFPQANGADMAVQSAIGIQQQMLEYNGHRAKCGYRPLEIGIGIHTGTLMLGVVGVHNRMQNTVISDAVNLASRVEGLTKAFGVSMAISGQTFQKLDHPENYIFRYLGNVKVKGKGEPTRVYEILNGISQIVMEKKKQTNMFFEQGLFSFVMKDYRDALENFNRVLAIMPDDQASLIYREHCREKLYDRSARAG